MQNEFRFTGMWYLPDATHNSIYGTLVFTPDTGAVLQLNGGFLEVQFGHIPEALKPTIVVGSTSNYLQQVTLYRCGPINSYSYVIKLPIAVVSSHTQCEYVLIGGAFYKEEEIVFTELRVNFNNLDDWIRTSGITVKYNQLEEPDEVSILYQRPEPISLIETDDYRAAIEMRISPVQRGPEFSANAVIDQHAYIVIRFQKPTAMNECRRVIDTIQGFLSLAISKLVAPVSITATPEKALGDNRKSISILYQLPRLPIAEEYRWPFHMLFPLSNIPDKLTELFGTYLAKREVLEPVYDLYFGVIDNPFIYPQHRFLSLVQAVETYHRRTKRNNELLKDQHTQRINAILASAPEAHKQWLKEKLQFSNEPTLAIRLSDLWTEFAQSVGASIPSKDMFVKKVKDTRNYLTHYNRDLRSKAISGKELEYFTVLLQVLLEYWLLRELGFSEHQAAEQLKSRGPQYSKFNDLGHELGLIVTPPP